MFNDLFSKIEISTNCEELELASNPFEYSDSHMYLSWKGRWLNVIDIVIQRVTFRMGYLSVGPTQRYGVQENIYWQSY
jgi:hypothetical protein